MNLAVRLSFLRSSFVLRCTAIFAGALSLAFSWIDPAASPAAWLGMLLLFTAVVGLSENKAFAAGFLFGLIYMSVALHWAPQMFARTLNCDDELLKPWLVFLAMAAWEAIPLAALGAAAASTARRELPLWACAAGWIVMERFWPRVFPWSLAHTQIGFPPFVQAAELGGIYLVSFILTYACLDLAVRTKTQEFVPRPLTCGPLLLVLLSLVFGWLRLASLEDSLSEKEILRIGVVQVIPAHVESMQEMRKASQKLPAVDVLVWPESTLGCYTSAVNGLDEIRQDMKIVHRPFLDWTKAQDLGAWLLVGGKTFEPGTGELGPYYQTAYLIDTEGTFRGRYHKRALMPIGEYMPMEQTYPALHDWAQLSKKAAWGTSDIPLLLNDEVSIGALLCYEDIVAELSRRTVASGAEVLISMINASAFKDPLALDQHLRLSTLRSIENRRTLVRCAGTGVSCCIDPRGTIVTRLPTNTEGQFVAEARLNSYQTVYTRFGYLLPHLAAVALGALTVKSYLA